MAIINMVEVPEEIKQMHAELCAKLQNHSVMLLVLGPHGPSTQFYTLLNDKKMLPFFTELVIMTQETQESQEQEIDQSKH